MPKQSSQKPEQVFTTLPEYGYSKNVTNVIWQWYHPYKKAEPIF
jgi:hypothetical protein